jgi:hypothetical protein
MVMKTIYLNGVVVGEVTATGDYKKDLESARTLLKAKGLHREVSRVQAMFRQAVSFATTSAYLYSRDLERIPGNGFTVAPFVVNSSFAIELYLKTLHEMGNARPRGHALLKLYDELPTSKRNLVARHAVAAGRLYKVDVANGADFRQILADLNNSFSEWRYCYESGNTRLFKIQPAIMAMKALHQACRDSGACQTDERF